VGRDGDGQVGLAVAGVSPEDQVALYTNTGDIDYILYYLSLTTYMRGSSDEQTKETRTRNKIS
jgi:hypothetical protein